MTETSYTTIADRDLAHKQRSLLLAITIATTTPYPKVARMATRMTKPLTRRLVRAARDVERQRNYERGFERMASVMTFPTTRKFYGQPGTYTGD